MAPLAAHANAGVWRQVTGRERIRRTAELLFRPVLPAGANLQRRKRRTRFRDALPPASSYMCLRRLRCRMALPSPAGGLATPVGRPKNRSPAPVFKGLQHAVAATPRRKSISRSAAPGDRAAVHNATYEIVLKAYNRDRRKRK